MSLDLAIVDAPASGTSGNGVTPLSRRSGRTLAHEADGLTQKTEDCLVSDVSAIRVNAAAENASPGLLADLIQLTKPRIVVMVLVTTVAAAMIAAGGVISLSDLIWLVVGTGLVAGSAGAANQVWERQIDTLMARTAVRPLPDQRMSLAMAVLFTAATGILGTTVLAVAFGTNPAIVGLATWLLYVLVYTPLKTRTAWNTTVGAIAGALPMLIGYTATGGGLLDATGWLLVGVLVFWQYPHFMSIAWMYRRQYADAGFCMTTTVEPTGRDAAIQSVAGSVALILSAGALCLGAGLNWISVLSLVAVVAVIWPMFRASIRFAAQRDDLRARAMLRSSLLVLPLVLMIVTLRILWG